MVAVLKDLIRQKDVSTSVFYSLIFGISLFLAFLPFSRENQMLIMEKFHLRSPSFAQWSILQFVPSMYNFSNEVWLSPSPLSKTAVDGGEILPQGAQHFWMNHYPIRIIYFSLGHRRDLVKKGKPVYALVRSRFRGHELVTRYKIYLRGSEIHLVRVYP